MRRQRHDLFYCKAPDGSRFLRWPQPPDGTLRVPAAPRHRLKGPKNSNTDSSTEETISSLLVTIPWSTEEAQKIRRTKALVAVVQEQQGVPKANHSNPTEPTSPSPAKRKSKLTWTATLNAHRMARLLSAKVPVDALPAGALVFIADGGLPSLASAGLVRLQGTDDLYIDEQQLEPLDDCREASRDYLESLPRGRKAAFGAKIPLCVSKLQYDQAIQVAQVAGFRLREKALEFELSCSKAATLWNPTRSGSWLNDVLDRCAEAGLKVSASLGDIGGQSEHPQAAEALVQLSGEGGAAPGANAALLLAHDIASIREHIQKAILVGSATGNGTRRVLQCEASGRLHQFSVGPHFGFCSKTHFKKWEKKIMDVFQTLGGKLPQSEQEPLEDEIQVVDETANEQVEIHGAEAERDMKTAHRVLRPNMYEKSAVTRDLELLQQDNLKVLAKNLEKISISTVLDYLKPEENLPSLGDIYNELKPVVEGIEQKYNDAWAKEFERDRRAVASICFTNANTKCNQPYYQEAHDLYHEAWMRLPSLYLFTVQLARLFGQDGHVQVSVKPLRRAFAKVFTHDPLAFARRDMSGVLDFVRCSCTFDSLSVLASAAEFVKTELSSAVSVGRRQTTLTRLGLPQDVCDLSFRFIYGKNRFAKPAPGGYRDMLLYIDIDGHAAEIQLQYSGFASLVENGWQLYRWARIVKESETNFVGEAVQDDKQLYGDKDQDQWLRTGYGCERYLDGSVYIGEWGKDTWCGFGTLWCANGDIYQGQWVDGEQHGRVTVWYKEGSVYQGDFVHGFKDPAGAGCTWIPDGTAEVHGLNGTLKATFSADRQKATIEECHVVKTPESVEGKASPDASPKTRKSHSNAPVPVKPPEPVPVHEAVKMLEMKDYPSKAPPELKRIDLPEVISGEVIQQRKLPGEPREARETEEVDIKEARRMMCEILRSQLQ